MKNVREIVTEYLKANGYDGLCADDCGCGTDELCPCAEMFSLSYCVPAKKIPTPKDHEYYGECDHLYTEDTTPPKRKTIGTCGECSKGTHCPGSDDGFGCIHWEEK